MVGLDPGGAGRGQVAAPAQAFQVMGVDVFAGSNVGGGAADGLAVFADSLAAREGAHGKLVPRKEWLR